MSEITIPDNKIPSVPPPASTITIHKYKFNPTTTCEIDMPEGAEIFSMHKDTLWARVDTSRPMEKRKIASLYTGEPICATEMGKPLGTVFVGGQVRHIFDCSSVCLKL